MLLQNDFFVFTKPENKDDHYTANIRLRPTHPIFQGHFPGQPLVPGVCMLQMVKEVVSSIVQKPVRLVSGDTLKFLSFIDPRTTPSLEMKLQLDVTETTKVSVTASLINSSVVFFKLSGEFLLLN